MFLFFASYVAFFVSFCEHFMPKVQVEKTRFRNVSSYYYYHYHCYYYYYYYQTKLIFIGKTVDCEGFCLCLFLYRQWRGRGFGDNEVGIEKLLVRILVRAAASPPTPPPPSLPSRRLRPVSCSSDETNPQVLCATGVRKLTIS